jgi:NADPH:quinone reductase-like Zn-dependent oxidoreductase
MKAIQVNKAELGPVVIQAELQKPEPGLGEILIHVHAVGVTQQNCFGIPQHIRN